MHELTVYVAPGCPCCAQARALAADFAEDRPDVRVRLVDVAAQEMNWPLPPGFAGTPMFYVGDTVLSYGNPTAQQLHRAFGEAV